MRKVLAGRLPLALWGLAVLFATAVQADAQTAANVLVVVNDASPESVKIGEYYAAKRGIAADHVARLQAPTTDTIERAEYLEKIENPIGSWVGRQKLQDTVLYIVLTKGVPLRIAGTGEREGTLSSVDSELTVLYRKLAGLDPPISSKIDNPYFLGNRPVSELRPFSRDFDIYLVTRLDGFSVDDVLKLIDRSAGPAKAGTIVLDEKATFLDRGGDGWLEEAANRLDEANAGVDVLLEETRALATTTAPVLGYYSWGSNDPSNQLRRFGFQFVPGAIGAMYVSTDGRSFAEPPEEWRPSDPNGRGRLFAGSFQSLAGDLIRDGITGIAAHVSEPFLEATIRPQVLFPAYVSGLNLAESFYAAMPYLSWRTVVIGDPLTTPFPRPASAVNVGAPSTIDPDTELPKLFSDRRMTAATATAALNRDALKLMFKSEARAAADPAFDVEPLLVQAVTIEPRLIEAQLRLGGIYQKRGDYARAIERFRAVVAVDPQHVIALNDLAYSLAVHQNSAEEALPLAQRAYRYDNSAFVADTVGWIHHLLGNDSEGRQFIDRAVIAMPDNVEILIHAATIRAAGGDVAKATDALNAAIKLDPTVADRADVKALQERLKAPPARGRAR